MGSMDPWMIWNTKLGSLDLRDETETEVRQVKRETEVKMVSQAKEETLDFQEKWDPWVYLDPWVNLDIKVHMVHQDFLDKSVQSVRRGIKESVVIWVPWAIRASKVKKAIKVTRVVGVMWVQQDQFVSKVRKVCSTAATVKA